MTENQDSKGQFTPIDTGIKHQSTWDGKIYIAHADVLEDHGIDKEEFCKLPIDRELGLRYLPNGRS